MASFFGKYGLQGFPLSGRFAPKPLGLFLLEALAVSKPVLLGLRGPDPPLFFQQRKKRGKRSAARAPPLNPFRPACYTKGWAASHSATNQVRLAALKKRFLFPWAAGKLQGHGKWNAFFREANAAQRRGRHSRWCGLVFLQALYVRAAGLVMPSAGEATKRLVCPLLWADQPLCREVFLVAWSYSLPVAIAPQRGAASSFHEFAIPSAFQQVWQVWLCQTCSPSLKGVTLPKHRLPPFIEWQGQITGIRRAEAPQVRKANLLPIQRGYPLNCCFFPYSFDAKRIGPGCRGGAPCIGCGPWRIRLGLGLKAPKGRRFGLRKPAGTGLEAKLTAGVLP